MSSVFSFQRSRIVHVINWMDQFHVLLLHLALLSTEKNIPSKFITGRQGEIMKLKPTRNYEFPASGVNLKFC